MERWLQRVDQQLRRRRSAQLDAGNQGAQAAGRRRGRRRGGGRQPRVLHLEVLPPPALPAGRSDRFAAPGVEAAVGQGRREVAIRKRSHGRRRPGGHYQIASKESSHGNIKIHEGERRHRRIADQTGTSRKSRSSRSRGASSSPASVQSGPAAARAGQRSATSRCVCYMDNVYPSIVKFCAGGKASTRSRSPPSR